MREPDDVITDQHEGHPARTGPGTPDDLESRLLVITSVLRDALPEADHAGLVVSRRGRGTQTRGATDSLVVELDRRQHVLDEGPGLHAMRLQRAARLEPAAGEARWPRFLAEAARHGIRAQLSVPVVIDQQTRGALSVYSTTHDTWSPDSERVVALVAAPTGVVLAHAHRVENLTSALESRKAIGIALGITMHRFDLDEDLAFAYLTRLAATTETKLRDVAASVVAEHTGGGGPARGHRPERDAD